MASLLPGAGPGAAGPKCGLATGPNALSLSTERVYHDVYWVSTDGRYAFFPSAGEGPACGTPNLYMRDLVAEETLRIDGPPLSGPDCPGAMIRSTPAAVYFWTQSRLAAEDTAISGGCQNPGESVTGGDVYRYDISAHEFTCLTCVVPGGGPANVAVGGENEGGIRSIAVAPEGPRLYFTTSSQLLPGAAQAGRPAIYRVNTETGTSSPTSARSTPPNGSAKTRSGCPEGTGHRHRDQPERALPGVPLRGGRAQPAERLRQRRHPAVLPLRRRQRSGRRRALAQLRLLPARRLGAARAHRQRDHLRSRTGPEHDLAGR